MLHLKDTSSENGNEKQPDIQPLAGATASQPGEDLPSTKTTNEDDKEENRKRIYRCKAKQTVTTGPSSLPFTFFDKMLKGEVDLQHDVELPSFLSFNEEKRIIKLNFQLSLLNE